MKLSILASALGALVLSSTAFAGTPTVQSFTATPNGFLVTSTLVSGDKDAVLIDAQFTLAEAHRVVAMILDSKKNLTTIYITHGHPDHYFGLEVIKAAFPKVKIVALDATVKEIKATSAGKVKQWGPMYGAQITTKPITPTVVKDSIDLEGTKLELHGPMQGDDEHGSYVWIPSIKTVVAGDMVYNGVHVWTAETDAAKRAAWVKTLDEISALNATVVVAGHKAPTAKDDPAAVKWTKDYLTAFDAAVAANHNPDDVQKAMKAKYKDAQMDVILQLGATAQYQDKAAPAPAKK
ncbi:MAG TPA: MBL fold metallo-hydrolase [Kofleriaceae bacterium]|jgi:glyoxylase-like metal-dependent hydrolase (beta-lactamase superfamily II)